MFLLLPFYDHHYIFSSLPLGVLIITTLFLSLSPQLFSSKSNVDIVWRYKKVLLGVQNKSALFRLKTTDTRTHARTFYLSQNIHNYKPVASWLLRLLKTHLSRPCMKCKHLSVYLICILCLHIYYLVHVLH